MGRIQRKWDEYLAGIALCAILAALGTWINVYLPLGQVTLSILIGIVAGNALRIPQSCLPGVGFAEKHLLSLAIMLLGVKLNFLLLAALGIRALVLIALGLGMTLLGGWLIGKIFGIDSKLALLLGTGNAVCGSSAIAAVTPVVGAKSEQMVIAVTVVNLLGTLGIFLLPLLAHLLFAGQLADQGIFIGNTLQAVGQVSAAGFALGEQVGQGAMLVKMGRILMLGPILIMMTLLLRGHTEPTACMQGKKFPIPMFIIGFALFALLASLNWIPPWAGEQLGQGSELLLSVAMAAMGLKIRFASLFRYGSKALLAGGLIWGVQLLTTGVVLKLL